MEWEILVDTTQAGDEMIFEGADGAFRSIASMEVRRDKLKVDVGVTKKSLQSSRAFVVKAMELRA